MLVAMATFSGSFLCWDCEEVFVDFHNPDISTSFIRLVVKSFSMNFAVNLLSTF